MGPRKFIPQLYKLGATNSERSNLATYSIKESEKESRASNETSSDDVPPQTFTNGGAGRPPAFGAGNTLLVGGGGKDGLKRRKPKTNMVKSNSSYISRVIPHEAMSKRLQERNPDGLFAFANINRAFQWLDLSTNVTYKVFKIILP